MDTYRYEVDKFDGEKRFGKVKYIVDMGSSKPRQVNKKDKQNTSKKPNTFRTDLFARLQIFKDYSVVGDDTNTEDTEYPYSIYEFKDNSIHDYVSNSVVALNKQIAPELSGILCVQDFDPINVAKKYGYENCVIVHFVGRNNPIGGFRMGQIGNTERLLYTTDYNYTLTKAMNRLKSNGINVIPRNICFVSPNVKILGNIIDRVTIRLGKDALGTIDIIAAPDYQYSEEHCSTMWATLLHAALVNRKQYLIIHGASDKSLYPNELLLEFRKYFKAIIVTEIYNKELIDLLTSNTSEAPNEGVNPSASVPSPSTPKRDMNPSTSVPSSTPKIVVNPSTSVPSSSTPKRDMNPLSSALKGNPKSESTESRRHQWDIFKHDGQPLPRKVTSQSVGATPKELSKPIGQREIQTPPQAVPPPPRRKSLSSNSPDNRDPLVTAKAPNDNKANPSEPFGDAAAFLEASPNANLPNKRLLQNTQQQLFSKPSKRRLDQSTTDRRGTSKIQRDQPKQSLEKPQTLPTQPSATLRQSTQPLEGRQILPAQVPATIPKTPQNLQNQRTNLSKPQPIHQPSNGFAGILAFSTCLLISSIVGYSMHRK
jgi:hypothetical protein